RNHIIVPRELIRLRSRRSGGEVVKVSTHHQRPRIIEALQRIWPCTQPLRRDRSFLGRIGQQFFFPQPALLVGLRGQRSGGVIGQLHFARITRKPSSLRWRDVEKHLLRIRRDHVNRTIPHLYRRRIALIFLLSVKQQAVLWRQARHFMRHNRLQPLHILLVPRAAA